MRYGKEKECFEYSSKVRILVCVVNEEYTVLSLLS